MNLEARTQKACSGIAVRKAVGLQPVSCEGKGSCWLVAALASFESLINSPRNLSLKDRAVDLCCRLDVLDRFTQILNGSDDELGGLLHAVGDQLRKVFGQLLMLPLVSKARRGGETAGWYLIGEGDAGGWQGDLCYQVMAQCAPSNPMAHPLLPARASSMLPCNTRDLTFTMLKAMHLPSSHVPPFAPLAYAVASHMHCSCAGCST